MLLPDHLTHEIHLWRISLDELPPDISSQILADEERHRADRFTSAILRRRFIGSHCARRLILAGYLNVPPHQLHFMVQTHGKPTLAWPTTPLCFNLSHSGNAMLMAVTHRLDLGVDLENIQPHRDYPRLVERCFGHEERAYWQALTSTERTEAFYRLWTIKEAWVKAIGRGIAMGLAACEINLTTTGRFSRLPAPYHPVEWRYQPLDLSAGQAAAMVWRHDVKSPRTLRHYNFVWDNALDRIC